MMIWVFFLRFIVPVLGVFYGTSLIADEVEDRTITYLFTRPIRRGAVLVGKYLAYVVCTSLVVLPSVVLVFFLLVPLGQVARTFRPFAATWGCWRWGWPPTARFSRSSGAALKRPLVSGLVFVFGWEQIALLVPGYVKRFTVAHYVQGWCRTRCPRTGSPRVLQSVLRTTRRRWPASRPGGHRRVSLWLGVKASSRGIRSGPVGPVAATRGGNVGRARSVY
jgi:hypothetical protein